MTQSAANSSDRNRLLRTFRKWHSWGGLFLSLLILAVAATGILLNHKDAIFHGGEGNRGPSGLLTSTTDLRVLPIRFERALELAREHYGDVPLDKIELKDERGWLAYKISRGNGDEIRIDAETGEVLAKYEARMSGRAAPAFDWKKFVTDVHTGKILGTAGKLAIDATSIAIIALTLTGVYLWGLPLVRKRHNAQKRRSEMRSQRPAGLRRTPAGEG